MGRQQPGLARRVLRGRGGSLRALLEHYHADYADYAGDTSFHLYNAERLRAADTLLLSSRASFPAFRDDWSRVRGDPDAPAFRRELAALMNPIPKAVVSDRLTVDDLRPGPTRASSTARTATGRSRR